ncbi:MAG: type II toxin-antitoxin system Phd/YefM family antitoxin [Nitrospirae bacterium]|nr:type II toxin-antitoxin system Phd/YefM family antitoxin [Nitrospirota bacterium]
MRQVNIDEAKNQFPILIQEVIKGEDVIITQDNMAIIKMVSLSNNKTKAVFGLAKGLITISDDFDAPIDDFKDYIK